MLRFIMNTTRKNTMTAKEFEQTILAIVKRAKKKGFQIHKNNIDKAKPLSSVCGVIKAAAPYSTEDLLCR